VPGYKNLSLKDTNSILNPGNKEIINTLAENVKYLEKDIDEKIRGIKKQIEKGADQGGNLSLIDNLTLKMNNMEILRLSITGVKERYEELSKL
jgi:hypothetical protein